MCFLAEIGLRIAGDREQAVAEGLAKLPKPWLELLDAQLFESVDDPIRRYAMKPGSTATVHDEETGQDWYFRVNSHRARGPEYPAQKPVNERRILCLGDSFSFGLWCNEDESLVGHLARMANENETERDITWRGITIGVPGYHSGQQRVAFEQDGLALDPDVVVLYFNTNDILQNGFFYDDELDIIRVDMAQLPTGLRRVLWNSHLYGFLTRKLITEVVQKIESPHLDPSVSYAHVREDNQVYCRSEIARIKELCEERGIPLFVVNQPLMTWSEAARGRDWRLAELFHWAREMFDELELPQIGMLGWMRGYSDGVDRIEGLGPDEPLPEPDFRPDFFFADPSVQRWVNAFKAGAPLPVQELPEDPDFHLLGEGYASMARITYAAMQAEQLLP